MSLYIAPTLFPSHLNDNDGHPAMELQFVFCISFMIPGKQGKKENILFLVLINTSYSDILKIQIPTLHQTKIPHQAQKKFKKSVEIYSSTGNRTPSYRAA